MTDFFALFGLPRKPRIDLAELKEKYQQRARVTHPDQPHAQAGEFATLNDAYRVLSEPHLRLRHLLELDGLNAKTTQVPSELSEVFLEIGTLIQDVDRLMTKSKSTVLSKALVNSEIGEKSQLLNRSLEKLQGLRNRARETLKEIDRRFESPRDSAGELAELAARFSYLERWIAQLEERKTQLSLARD